MATKVYVVDLRKESVGGKTLIFSSFLEQQVRETLEKKEQVLLFLNKRGYQSHLICTSCGEGVSCPHCAISLSIHKHPSKGSRFLLCHFCGKVLPLQSTCTSCQQDTLQTLGVGTQQLEEESIQLFPHARIARMDMDTTSTKHAHEQLYHRMKNGEIDILIGTQMIAKGLDIPNVSLVGVVQADIGLHIPDFRAGERTFQLLTQVIGRGGRRGQESKAIIQTYHPEHPAITFATTLDYEGFYQHTIEERKLFRFPPFTHCIRCTFVHKDQATAYVKAKEVYDLLLPIIEDISPTNELFLTPASIPKQHGKYHYCLFLKGEHLHQVFTKIAFPAGWRIDVDPMHF